MDPTRVDVGVNPDLARNELGYGITTWTNGSPTSRFFKTTLGGSVQAREVVFNETAGAGTYTGSVTLPAGAVLLDVVVNGVALWDAATSATLIVGDDFDPIAFFAGVDLKASDLLPGESLSLALTGVPRRYSATARTITGTITTEGEGGTTGRTRMLVLFARPSPAETINEATKTA